MFIKYSHGRFYAACKCYTTSLLMFSWEAFLLGSWKLRYSLLLNGKKATIMIPRREEPKRALTWFASVGSVSSCICFQRPRISKPGQQCKTTHRNTMQRVTWTRAMSDMVQWACDWHHFAFCLFCLFLFHVWLKFILKHV